MLAQQVKSQPPTPSERLGKPVSSDLEQLILGCLAKNPDQRLPGAEALGEALDQCVSAGSWTTVAAQKWWRTNMGAVETLPAATMAEKTMVIAPRT